MRKRRIAAARACDLASGVERRRYRRGKRIGGCRIRIGRITAALCAGQKLHHSVDVRWYSKVCSGGRQARKSGGRSVSDEPNHSEGLLVEKFCTQRKSPKSACKPCNNKYTDCLKDSWASSFKFPQLKNLEGGTVQRTDAMSQNAHHILCVAEVTKVMSKDEDLERILKKTVYCINAGRNMIALPLWSHTVHWYCTDRGSAHEHWVDEASRGVSARRGVMKFMGGIATWDEAPPFKNLPNHDYDHIPYNREVETALRNLKAEIKEADHDFDSNELAACLNGMSDSFRSKLKARGLRRGGTHEMWMAALNDDDPHWYEPFSLADDGDVTEQAWPGRTFDSQYQKTIDRLMNAIMNR